MFKTLDDGYSILYMFKALDDGAENTDSPIILLII